MSTVRYHLSVEQWGWADLAAMRRRKFYTDPTGHRDLDADAILGAAGEVALARFLQEQTGARSLFHWALSLDRDESDGLPDLYQYHVRSCRHYAHQLLVRPTATRDGKWAPDDVLVMARMCGPWDPINRPQMELVGWMTYARFQELASHYDDQGGTHQEAALGVLDDQMSPMDQIPRDRTRWEEWIYNVLGFDALKYHMEDMSDE